MKMSQEFIIKEISVPESENNRNNGFRCKYCSVTKQKWTEISKHYLSLHKYCVVCRMDFKEKDEIVEHLQNRHNTKIKCSNCEFVSFDLEMLQLHESDCQPDKFEQIYLSDPLSIDDIKQEKEEDPFQSFETLVKQETNQDEIRDENQEFGQEQSLKITDIQGKEAFFALRSKNLLKKAQNSKIFNFQGAVTFANGSTADYKCTICTNIPETFPTQSLLLQHIESAHKQNKIKNKVELPTNCEMCGLSVHNNVMKHKHLLEVHNFCNICKIYLAKGTSTVDHLVRFHGAKVDNAKCWKCGYISNDYQGFQRHITSSHPELLQVYFNSCVRKVNQKIVQSFRKYQKRPKNVT